MQNVQCWGASRNVVGNHWCRGPNNYWVCGSLGETLIPRLHLTIGLLCIFWLQTNLYRADSGCKRISTVQTLAANESLPCRLWLQTNLCRADSGCKWCKMTALAALALLFYSGRKWRRVVHLFIVYALYTSKIHLLLRSWPIHNPRKEDNSANNSNCRFQTEIVTKRLTESFNCGGFDKECQGGSGAPEALRIIKVQ